jgi:mRNA interferase MazF
VVTAETYLPDRGEVVWIDLNPVAGHEQAGRRPVVVLSPARYNRRTDLMLICPITNHVKGYGFEVPLPAGVGVTGVVLADQIRCVDWRFRRITFITKLPQIVTSAVQQKAVTLIVEESSR